MEEEVKCASSPVPPLPSQHPREASPLWSLGATWLRAQETPSS